MHASSCAVLAAALLAPGAAAGEPALPSAAAPATTAAPAPRGRSTRQITVSAGFAHWYGGTFDAPVGMYTPGITVGVRPGLAWLEARLHYTVSLVELPLPAGGASRVGFALIEGLLTHELRTGIQRLMIGGGPLGGLVHTAGGVGAALGGVLTARLLIAISRVAWLGPFFELRALLYTLPGSALPIYEFRDGQLRAGHSDAQIDLGVAMSFW